MPAGNAPFVTRGTRGTGAIGAQATSDSTVTAQKILVILFILQLAKLIRISDKNCVPQIKNLRIFNLELE
jgi:hypothetical protein